MSKPATALYQRYLRLVGVWGVDPTKPGRDFGLFLRQRLPEQFKDLEFTVLTPEEYTRREKSLESLERLADNTYFKNIENQSTATGATLEECRTLLSQDAANFMQAQEDGLFRNRVRRAWNSLSLPRSPVSRR